MSNNLHMIIRPLSDENFTKSISTAIQLTTERLSLDLMDINLPLKIKNNKKVPYSDETVTNHHETFQRGKFLN